MRVTKGVWGEVVCGKGSPNPAGGALGGYQAGGRMNFFSLKIIFISTATVKCPKGLKKPRCSSFTINQTQFVMGNLLYIIAVILVIIWAISFFGGFFTGGIIHVLLVIAIIAILLRVISGRNPV